MRSITVTAPSSISFASCAQAPTANVAASSQEAQEVSRGAVAVSIERLSDFRITPAPADQMIEGRGLEIISGDHADFVHVHPNAGRHHDD